LSPFEFAMVLLTLLVFMYQVAKDRYDD